jgi:hypothetical protein
MITYESASYIATPQPTPTKGGAPVLPVVTTFLHKKWGHRPFATIERLLTGITKRIAFGTKKYGTPLSFDNGRNFLIDWEQELCDGVNYGLPYLIQRFGSYDAAPERLRVAYDFQVAAALGVQAYLLENEWEVSEAQVAPI